MKKAVLIIAFIFILLSVSQVSAVLVYNSARSNVSNKILEDVGDTVDLLLDISGSMSWDDAKKIHVNVLSSVTILHGSWNELNDVPCDWRTELGLEECGVVATPTEGTR